MSNSDIFDRYAKIAEEQGLVSVADEQESKPKESAKLKKYKKSPYPRLGSDDISTIEALYNVKPDSIIEYELNIMEAAHPKPVVIAPAYDRLNALVENNIERQNIITNIVMKPTDGNLVNKKYAEKEFLMQLIRVANDLDNANNEELRVIADACIETLTEKKNFKKEALAPLVIVGIAASVLAGFWLQQHANDPDRGLVGNMHNAITQLNDLKETSWYESTVDETVQREADNLIKRIQSLQAHAADFNRAVDSIYRPASLNDNNEVAKFTNSIENNGQSAKASIERFVRVMDSVIPDIITSINNFTSSFYQKQHTEQSWLGDAAGWLGEAAHGRWGLIANDFISAANALGTLKESLMEARKFVNNFDNIKQNQEQKLKSQVAAFNGNDDEPKQKNVPTEDNEEEQGSGNEGGYEDVVEFLGHKPSKRELDFFRSLK